MSGTLKYLNRLKPSTKFTYSFARAAKPTPQSARVLAKIKLKVSQGHQKFARLSTKKKIAIMGTSTVGGYMAITGQTLEETARDAGEAVGDLMKIVAKELGEALKGFGEGLQIELPENIGLIIALVILIPIILGFFLFFIR